jgi:hypothetical protein
MKNSNNTREVIGAKDISKNILSLNWLNHDKSIMNVKIIKPAYFAGILLVITIFLLTSCFGVLRIHDSDRGEGHGHSEHHNDGNHHDLNYIKPLDK